jgi:hypothetical protein
MPCKRITISLTEDQFDNFREILPAKANISEVLADQIDMFISATKTYGDEFILDVMCNRNNFAIQKKALEKAQTLKESVSKKDMQKKPSATSSK